MILRIHFDSKNPFSLQPFPWFFGSPFPLFSVGTAGFFPIFSPGVIAPASSKQCRRSGVSWGKSRFLQSYRCHGRNDSAQKESTKCFSIYVLIFWNSIHWSSESKTVYHKQYLKDLVMKIMYQSNRTKDDASVLLKSLTTKCIGSWIYGMPKHNIFFHCCFGFPSVACNLLDSEPWANPFLGIK